MQPESKLQRQIRRRLEAEWPKSWWTKFHGGPFTAAGVPDLVGVVEGRSFFLEVKRKGEHASRVQLRRHDQLRRAGAFVAVVRTRREAVEFVRASLEACGATPPKTCEFTEYAGGSRRRCVRGFGHPGLHHMKP